MVYLHVYFKGHIFILVSRMLSMFNVKCLKIYVSCFFLFLNEIVHVGARMRFTGIIKKIKNLTLQDKYMYTRFTIFSLDKNGKVPTDLSVHSHNLKVS